MCFRQIDVIAVSLIHPRRLGSTAALWAIQTADRPKSHAQHAEGLGRMVRKTAFGLGHSPANLMRDVCRRELTARHHRIARSPESQLTAEKRRGGRDLQGFFLLSAINPPMEGF